MGETGKGFGPLPHACIADHSFSSLRSAVACSAAVTHTCCVTYLGYDIACTLHCHHITRSKLQLPQVPSIVQRHVLHSHSPNHHWLQLGDWRQLQADRQQATPCVSSRGHMVPWYMADMLRPAEPLNPGKGQGAATQQNKCVQQPRQLIRPTEMTHRMIRSTSLGLIASTSLGRDSVNLLSPSPLQSGPCSTQCPAHVWWQPCLGTSMPPPTWHAQVM
jgi:hypothetical protein